MAFDGIVVANLVHELKEQLLNGRIAKIAKLIQMLDCKMNDPF